MNRVGAILALAVLTACNRDALVHRFTPADVDARDRAYLAWFVRGHIDSADARLTPGLRTPEVRTDLEKFAGFLATARMDSMKVIGANTVKSADTRRVSLTYELSDQPKGWLLANVSTLDSAGTWFVEGASVQPIARPLEEIDRFTLSGKPPLFFLFMIVTALCAVVSLGVSGFMATRKGMPNRWWWALASLIGVGSLSLNWATGQVGFNLLTIQLFAAGAVATGPYAPWVLNFALPLGAMAALAKFRSWRRLSDRAASPAGAGALPETAV